MAFLLILLGTLSLEISSSMGKSAVNRHSETVFTLGFLSLFWGAVLFAASILAGADFVFSSQSLPLFIPRLILEIILAHIAIKSIIIADRTTVSFLHLVTIPFLLVVDIVLGYNIVPQQIIGIFMVLMALSLVFWHNPLGRKGAGLVIASSLLAVATTSLYKYNITHYNSVAAEQLIVVSALLLYFTFLSLRVNKEAPWKQLGKKYAHAQSLTHGFGGVIISFAYIYAPASIIIVLKRSLSILWTIISGRAVFHESNIYRKLLALSVAAVGVMLLV